MAIPFLVCTKAEQRSMVHFLWAEGTLNAAIQMFMCLVWGLHAFSEKCIWVDKNVQDWPNKCNWSRALWRACNINQQWENGRCQIHGSQRQKSNNHSNCPSQCTTALGPTRLMHDGFPGNWKESITSLLWTSAPVTWNIIIMNERTSWKAHYHRGWNLDSSIQTWEQTTEHAVET